MITTFNAFTIESGNYDLLETGNENPSDAAKWLREKTAECEAKAKEYLATKQRTKYYLLSCELELGAERYYLLPFSDEEVARVKPLVVDEYRAYMGVDGSEGEDEPIASTFEEVCEDIHLCELAGNDELDSLVFERAQNDFGEYVYVHSIDFEHPRYLYRTSYFEYGMEKPFITKVELTDEDYVYLVTQKLLNERFSFNRLLLYRPKLAQAINEQLDGCAHDYLWESDGPFLIMLDEIDMDAEAINKREKIESDNAKKSMVDNTTDLIIPQRRRVIQEGEFACRDDIQTVTMPDSVNVIKKDAFWGCHNLKTVKLSKNLKTIESGAFYNCPELKSVTFPEGLESIGESAFFKCFGLESLVIPKSVKTIGKDAFGMCQQLKHVKMARTTDISNKPFLDDDHVRIEYYE